jgi:hypothetical protein
VSAGDAVRIVTADNMFALAKKLRLKAYYDTGDPEGDSDHEAAVRGGRSSALIEFADAIDETMQFDSTLTQDDLGRRT